MLKWLFLLLDSVPVSFQKTRGSGSAENPEERAGGGSFPPPAVRGGPGPPRRRGSPVHSATPNGAAGRGSGGPVSPRSSRGRGGDTRPRPAPLGAAQARQEAGNRRHRLGERRQRVGAAGGRAGGGWPCTCHRPGRAGREQLRRGVPGSPVGAQRSALGRFDLGPRSAFRGWAGLCFLGPGAVC